MNYWSLEVASNIHSLLNVLFTDNYVNEKNLHFALKSITQLFFLS